MGQKHGTLTSPPLLMSATHTACLEPKALRRPHVSPTAADEPLPLAPALSPAHCPLCAFQSAFWQPTLQYDATAHTEHFFSGTPVTPHEQQLFLGRGGSGCSCCC